MGLPSTVRSGLIALALASCSSPTGPAGPADIGTVAADLRMATSRMVVVELFRFTPYVLGAVTTPDEGCVWAFFYANRAYQPTDCGNPVAEVLVYAIVEPDLPHVGGAVPVALPLVPVGALQLTHDTCAGGITVTDGLRTLLEACPAPGGSWTGTLLANGRSYPMSGMQESLTVPSARVRHTITIEGRNGARAVLRSDILTGLERSESVLTIDDGRGNTLRLEGYAGATGPAYQATLNGEAAGAISWQGNAGFVTSGPHDDPPTPAEDLRLREAEYLIRTLGRLGDGTAAIVGARAGGAP